MLGKKWLEHAILYTEKVTFQQRPKESKREYAVKICMEKVFQREITSAKVLKQSQVKDIYGNINQTMVARAEKVKGEKQEVRSEQEFVKIEGHSKDFGLY